MKTIGLLGGMSWESSLEYYKVINQETKKILGGLNSAKILMHSVNFKEIEELQHQGAWGKLTEIMIENAQSLERGGADIVMICTNTMHLMANEIEENISIPLLHIADGTAKQIQEEKIKKVALLGTGFTMEKDFYKGRLTSKYGLEVMVPNKDDRKIIHDIIYNELCLGIITEESREKYVKIISQLDQDGAGGVILGCTEIGLLIKEQDSPIPIFDTTFIHALSAVAYANAKD